MEALHQGYRDIMAMPVGRRKRLCEEYDNLLRVRKRRQEQQSKSQGPRRRR